MNTGTIILIVIIAIIVLLVLWYFKTYNSLIVLRIAWRSVLLDCKVEL